MFLTSGEWTSETKHLVNITTSSTISSFLRKCQVLLSCPHWTEHTYFHNFSTVNTRSCLIAKRHQELNFHRLFPELCTSLPWRHAALNSVNARLHKNTLSLVCSLESNYISPLTEKQRLNFTAESRTSSNC